MMKIQVCKRYLNQFMINDLNQFMIPFKWDTWFNIQISQKVKGTSTWQIQSWNGSWMEELFPLVKFKLVWKATESKAWPFNNVYVWIYLWVVLIHIEFENHGSRWGSILCHFESCLKRFFWSILKKKFSKEQILKNIVYKK